VRAAYVPAGYYLPFLVMDHENLLEKRGYSLEIQQFQDNAQMISLFLNRHLDVTAQSALTMFPLASEYPGTFKFIYGQYANSYFFMVPKDSEIQRLEQLRDIRIGTWKSPTAENFIRLILRNGGLTDDEYTIQRFGALDWAPALQNGVVTVVFGFDVPLASLAATGEYRYVAEESLNALIPERPVFNGGAFIASSLITNDLPKAKAIHDALLEAINIINNDPKRAGVAAATMLNADVKVITDARFDHFVRVDDDLVLAAEETFDLLKQNSIVATQIDIPEMFWAPNTN
jgi:ABC-type nitrate/sulfonate/bicarbonate transport system substrate-binding protein